MNAVVLNVERSEPRLLDLTAAVDYPGIGRSAIRQLVDSRRLSRVRLPSLSKSHGSLDRFLLDKADLDAFIDQCKERQHSRLPSKG